MQNALNRREFVAGAAAAAGGLAAGALAAAPGADPKSILNYNPNMEYRRLGKTGLTVSAVCMGGHWKRLATMMARPFKGSGAAQEDFENLKDPAFIANRRQVITHAMAAGINYIDACSPQEILAYSTALGDRRKSIHFGFSWHTREPRYTEWRTAKKLVEGLEMSLKEARLEHVDVWRISLPMEGIADLGELRMVEQATVEALEQARRQGKARATGVSSHNRVWLKSIIEQYPGQIQVVLFPYTANSKQLPDDSVFDAIKEHNVGAFGIKPFADNSLFAGNGALNSPQAAEDDRRARLALRYILGNPAITAPIPGLINTHQVDNAVAAVQERRKLNPSEKAELEHLGHAMWARLSPDHQWLREWEYV